MKKYRIELDDMSITWSCVIAIDLDYVHAPNGVPTGISVMEQIQQMVHFWTGWEERLEAVGGDYVAAFLKQAAENIFRLCHCARLSVKGAIEVMKEEEGYCWMDGSNGITLLEVDEVDYLQERFKITELNEE